MNMAMNWPIVDENYVPAYQISSLPFLTSSIINNGDMHAYSFPFVTRFITIQNRGSTITDKICLSFTPRGMNPVVGNYITLDQGDSINQDIRTTELFISCSSGTSVDYQIFCGLTTISSKNFLKITGSNGHAGVG